jgi:hypothetical protein
VTQLMVPGGAHGMMLRGRSKEGLGGGQHVTSMSTAEIQQPLASPGDSTQTEVPTVSLQYAEATDKRAWLSDNGRGSIERADRGGGRILLQGAWSFVFKITRLKLVKHK